MSNFVAVPIEFKFKISCTEELLSMKDDLVEAQKFLNGYLVNQVSYSVSQEHIKNNRFGVSIIFIHVKIVDYDFEDRVKEGLNLLLNKWGKIENV